MVDEFTVFWLARTDHEAYETDLPPEQQEKRRKDRIKQQKAEAAKRMK